MKGYKVGKGLAGAFNASGQFEISQNMGVEDLFSAVAYLAQNQEQLGIDPSNIVVAGSSAGAIITLAAIRDIANGNTRDLPEGFHFKGAMSFAGAIISTKGAPKFESAPCPVLLMHGTEDKAVAYNHLDFLGRGIWGSSYLAKKLKDRAIPAVSTASRTAPTMWRRTIPCSGNWKSSSCRRMLCRVTSAPWTPW
jgi:poly(3-hydroxybutyrate) depolymerase